MALKERFSSLKRDIGVCRNLLVRSPASAEASRDLVARLDALESDIETRTGAIYTRFEIDGDTVSGRAADAYQNLQLQRARELAEQADEEMFEL